MNIAFIHTCFQQLSHLVSYTRKYKLYKMFRLIVSIVFLYFNISLEICGQRTEPALLVISYDAFRPNYLNRGITPNLNKLRREGTSAAYMLNVFPTKTLVNHFTMATVSTIS